MTYSVEKYMGPYVTYKEARLLTILQNVPYFTRSVITTAQGLSSPVSMPLSLGKRVRVQTECIDQLKKWHGLLDEGIIKG